MSGPQDVGYTGPQDPTADTSPFNAYAFMVQQITGRMATTTLVKVKAVTNSGGVSPVGFVDVQPLVNQIDGDGNPMPHGIVHNVPYFRLQGGANAVILDPQVNDIGIACFGDHDISSVKANKAQSNPGSRRRFDMADGLYIGGFLNGTPVQYVQFTGGGISIVSPTTVTITAPSIVLNGETLINGALSQGTGEAGGTATLQGPVTVNEDLTANGTSLHTHVHGGVQTGSGDTGPPA